MVVCIDDVRHWLRGNAPHSRGNMLGRLRPTAGLDQNHSGVTDDYSGVNHVALIVLIGHAGSAQEERPPYRSS